MKPTATCLHPAAKDAAILKLSRFLVASVIGKNGRNCKSNVATANTGIGGARRTDRWRNHCRFD
jgi:hypothetical protein